MDLLHARVWRKVALCGVLGTLAHARVVHVIKIGLSSFNLFNKVMH